MRPGELPSLLRQLHFLFLPVTFNPGGSMGPAFSQFFWNDSDSPPSMLPLPPKAPLPSRYDACALQRDCYHHLANFGLLQRETHSFKEQHPSLWFTPFASDITPKQWAMHVLGHNLVVALSHHIATYQDNNLPSGPQLLHTAAIRPHFSASEGSSPLSASFSMLLRSVGSVIGRSV